MPHPTSNKIGLFTATSFAIGSMVGGGVFALSGVALKTAGPAAIISFSMAGIIVLFSALSLAAIAHQARGDESSYDVIGRYLTPVASFVVQWCFYLNAVIVSAFVLNAFGVYMHQFVTADVPVGTWAIVALLVLSGLNFASTRWIGRVESVLVIVKLAVLAILIYFGLFALKGKDFTPFLPHGGNGVLVGSATLFIAFLGFNVITNISREIKDPKRTIPRAIVLSMAVVTVVYIGVVVAMLAAGLHDYSEASVGVAATKLIGPIGGGIVVAGALIATLSAANANILGSSEIMMRLSAKKYVPTIFGKPLGGHPFVSVIFGILSCAGLLLIGNISIAVNLANVTAILGLVIIDCAAVVLVAKQSKRWLLGLVAIIGAVGALWQFAYIPTIEIGTGLGLVIIGMAIYTVRKQFFVHDHHREIVHAVDTGDTPIVRSLAPRKQ